MRRTAILLCATAALGVGCSGDGGSSFVSLEASPFIVDFADVPLRIGRRRTIELTNPSSDRAEIASVEILGGLGASGWLRIEGVPTSLNPREAVAVDFVLLPQAIGPLQGLVEIAVVGGGVTQLFVQATVSDAQLEFVPSAWDFGEVILDKTATASVDLINLGPSTATVSALEWSPSSVGLSARISGVHVLRAGDRVPVEVRFTPQQPGFVSTRVTARAALRSGVLELSGSAHDLSLDIQPMTLLFNAVLVGSRQRRTLRVRNVDSIERTLSRFRIWGVPQGDIDLIHDPLPLVLGPGQTAEIGFDYHPVNAGTFTGTISVDTTLGSQLGPRIFSTVVGGPTEELLVDASTVSFGTVALATVGRRRITVRNGGRQTIDWQTSIVGDAGFEVTQGAQALMPAGDLSFVELQARPESVGQMQAELRFTSSDLVIKSVTLHALGGGAPAGDLIPPPSVLDFGRYASTQNIVSELTLENGGTATLGGIQAQVIDDSGGVFSLLMSPPSELAPGERFILPVAASAQGAEQNLQGSLRIWSDDPDQAVIDITLLGSPVVLDPQFSITLRWTASADLDLHVVTPGGALFDAPRDLFWCEPVLPPVLGLGRLSSNARTGPGSEEVWLGGLGIGDTRVFVVHTGGIDARADIEVSTAEGDRRRVWRLLRPGQAWEAVVFDFEGRWGEPGLPGVFEVGDPSCR